MFAFFAVLERLAYLSIAHVYSEMSASQAFYGCEDDFFTLCVESQDVADQPVAFGQLFDFAGLEISTTVGAVISFTFHVSCIGIKEIKMVVAVTLTLIDELGRVPRQKYDCVLRLHVFRMHFFVENAHRLSCFCVILAKFGVVLVTVYFNQVEAFFIR